ncbi:MAG: NADH-quinone oxidoreductase subunit J [Pelovirga sp.]
MIATLMFYLLGAVALGATVMAIIQRNPVYAVIYLVKSIFSLALIFYLLGAPLIAALQVIIYAGAIMVLFLFVVMMLEVTPTNAATRTAPGWFHWGPVLLLALTLVVLTLMLIGLDPASAEGVPRWHASPRDFGYALFKEYALAVKIISFQLSFAAVGAFHVGTTERRRARQEDVS